jgi:hypothetical protein
MLQGEWKNCTIAKDGTLSAEVDLARAYEKLMVVIPTIDEASISVKVSEKSGGTFQDLYLTSLTDGDDDKAITTAGVGGITWTVYIGGFQFIKLLASAAQTTAAVTFRVCGIRS